MEWLKLCFQEHPVKLLHGKIMSHHVEKNENFILYTLFWKMYVQGEGCISQRKLDTLKIRYFISLVKNEDICV